MKIAVISDIHGNYMALNACLDYAFKEKAEAFIFLGDYLGDLPYPERTMAIMYDLKRRIPCFFVKGNKEDYWLDYQKNGENGWSDNNSITGTLLYLYRSLTRTDLDFFSNMQVAQKIELLGYPTILACHGSPYSVREHMKADDDRTLTVLKSCDADILLCGHTHRRLKLVKDGKTLLNPGSAGISIGVGGKAQFMMLQSDGGKWKEECIYLTYDTDRVIRDIIDSRLIEHAPYWAVITAYVLSGGVHSHAKILTKAMQLCKEESGKCVWPAIPEKYMKQAFETMVIESDEMIQVQKQDAFRKVLNMTDIGTASASTSFVK